MSTLFHNAAPAQPATLARRILNQGRYEAGTMLRNGEQLVLMVVMPLLGLLALVFTPLLDGMGHPRVAIAAPGILALCALSTAFTGQGIATGFDRRYGVLRFMSTTPLGKGGLIAGKVIAVLVSLALQVVLISAVAAFMGWRPPLIGVLLGIPLLILGAAAFTALGLLIAGTVRPEATLAITNLGWILFAALGGIVLPAAKFSSSLDGIVQWLPSGALGNLMRAALIESRLDLWGLLVLLAWGVAAAIAAVKWFKWN
ncbi:MULTISPECIES: ABC transporter permease [Arthrobacter]|uniref:ABC transporter n=1 Tax=Arthrobacter psychrochitiniphilus TaxID=291045 RepID=A0A2V3DQ43_9MICC|nr:MULTISPECIES: ABC transporter permease [Arthrobacter]NYG17546.1 ABC-2 type transport system permease protein [Arthrobacter psychrochitiniphilus]PXA64649.1 ABC transporter [Arthrobacter psychrochitiniphilus]